MAMPRTKSPKPTFNLGDRVKSLHPTAAITHGVIVYYQGKHRPRNPRVRWATGWGTTTKAENLVLLTAHELATLPPPQTIDRDLMSVADIHAEVDRQLQQAAA